VNAPRIVHRDLKPANVITRRAIHEARAVEEIAYAAWQRAEARSLFLQSVVAIADHSDAKYAGRLRAYAFLAGERAEAAARHANEETFRAQTADGESLCTRCNTWTGLFGRCACPAIETAPRPIVGAYEAEREEPHDMGCACPECFPEEEPTDAERSESEERAEMLHRREHGAECPL